MQPGRLLRLAVLLSLAAAACRLTAPAAPAETRPPTPTLAQTEPPARQGTPTRAPVSPTARIPGSPSPEESAAPSAGAGETPDLQAGLEAVLAACGGQEQARALRPGSELEWGGAPFPACYDLSLELEDRPEFKGRARVTLANQSGAALEELVFRLYPNADVIFGGVLRVLQARAGGESVQPEPLLEDGTALRLPLGRPLQPGAVLEVELEFEGRAPQDFGSSFGVYGVFNYSSRAGLMTLANAYPLLAAWEEGAWQYEPVNGTGDAVVSETALYRVEVRAPQGWAIAATGSALDESAQAAPALRVASGPVRDFMLVAGPGLVERQAEAGGVRVRHWGLAGGEDRWEEALQVALDSLAVFEERFGPYPYAELDIVAVPLRLASGVEYPGLVLIEQEEYTAASTVFLGIVVSHEVAHQWWYAVVGNDVLEAPWQDEALTSFSSLLYQQEHQPAAYRGTLEAYREQLEFAGEATAGQSIFLPLEAYDTGPGAYSTVVYLKGALFFVELREELGEEAFFEALQDYYQAFRYRLVEPEALLEAFENACGCELDSFYREWGL